MIVSCCRACGQKVFSSGSAQPVPKAVLFRQKDMICATGGKRTLVRGRNNLQETQITEQPTAWAHAVSLYAQALFCACRSPACHVTVNSTFVSDHTESEAIMKPISLEQELSSNTYPGRGIIIGRTPDGTRAAAAYFIMGRSRNSRNRIFVEDGDGIRTQAYDPSRLEDPSLIIYAPVRVLGNKTIVTNGDQTDTIYEGMDRQMTFEQSLRSRTFEPDAPNYTPRISGILHIEGGSFNYAMSILKSNDGDPDSCRRYTFAYENPKAGEGHFIHTYLHDGEPLPSFEGEPRCVRISNDMDAFTDQIWNSLNEENKVSLFVRYINLADGTWRTNLVNKNQ